MTRAVRWRSTAAGLAALGLVAGSVGWAGPAAAVPAGAWWYQELQLQNTWKISEGAGVTVAVVDDGVDAGLGDLQGQVLSGTDFTSSGGNGQKATPGRTNPNFSHGTAMATLIAGTGKGAGFVGVAPKARILPIKVATTSDSSGFAQNDIAGAIRYAVDRHAQIVSISLGSATPCSAADQSAVDYAVRHDVLVLAAVGDDASQAVSSPANCVGTLGIGGLANKTTLTAWSGESRGADLDFVSPGDRTMPLPLLDNTVSGAGSGETSAATAIAAGSFALVRAKYPQESVRALVTRVMWNVANGLGHGIFAKRVSNSLGYGEILPYYALTRNPPASAANPLWDVVDKHLAGGSASHTVTPSSPASATGSPAASSGGSGGSGAAPVVIIVLVAVLAAAAFVVLRLRRRT